MANTLWAYATMGRKPGKRAQGALEARVEEVAKECNSQNMANTLRAYATMGMTPGERAMGALEERVEEVAREGNSQAVTNTLRAYATMRWALGELDARAVVLSTDFGVREDALHVEGAYQNRGISLLDHLGGGGTSIPNFYSARAPHDFLKPPCPSSICCSHPHSQALMRGAHPHIRDVASPRKE